MENKTLADFLISRGLEIQNHSYQSNQYEKLTLSIWAKPGAKVQKIQIGAEGNLILYVKEKPIEGKANKAFIASLAKIFDIAKANIELASGQKSKFKKFTLLFEFTKKKDLGYYVDRVKNNLKALS